MVYIVKYKKALAAKDPHDKFTTSIFIESEGEPDIKTVVDLVREFSGNDFSEATIQIEEWPGWDAEEMRKQKMPVRKL